MLIIALQRQRFSVTVRQLEAGPTEEDLVFGLGGLGLDQGGCTLHVLLATCVTVPRVAGEGPDMFECQLKLFSGWWKQWTVEERQSFVQNPDMFK